MNKVLILDFGSQYTMLIARRVRELGVYCEIHPYSMALDAMERFNAKAIILSGGPASVMATQAPRCSPGVFELGAPILGICYGLQLMAHMLGGRVEAAKGREYGPARLIVDDASGLLESLAVSFDAGPGKGAQVWMSHGDQIAQLPPGFTTLAHTDSAPVAAMADRERMLYAVQFHPEVAHTPSGRALLSTFLFTIARCRPDWTMAGFIDQAIDRIRERVGQGRVVLGLSGGVDSAVAATLIHRAVGDRLTCLFVDNGLLRLGEAESVVATFKEQVGLDLVAIDASMLFLGRLAGVTEPEAKRRIIGEAFIQVFEKEAKGIGGVEFLGQGTLYPDVIESVSVRGPSATIKTHHNVGGLPTKMGLRLVEPLRELFKDEVREVGRRLGLPEAVLCRQPFPGPGLAVRILGEVTPEGLELLRRADAITTAEIEAWDKGGEVWQYFTVLLPVRSVGVMGDERTYEHVAAIRAVASVDGMTADWADLPRPLLSRISNRIINEVRGINRVVYDISSKPPATIEWE